MSAAEKLKALGKRFPPDPSEEWTAYELDDHVTALAALRNVLPQIVAVVENAEEECEQHSASLDGLRAALAALDAARTVDGKE